MTNEEEQYITLFCEGDGGVYITQDGYPRINFAQKERDVLDYIASLTEGGRIHPNGPNIWLLEFNGSNCIELLEIFSRHVVGKSFLDRLNRVLEHVDMPLAVQHPLTLDGFVGFWDAEGSSSNNPSIVVSQKDREVLDQIVEMFGGNVTPSRSIYVWQLSGKKARKPYKIVLEKSHCPSKAGRLRQNFEGPNFYELHTEEKKVYNDVHRDEQRAHQKKRDAENVEERRAYHKKHYAEQKLLLDYLKAHPEIIQQNVSGHSTGEEM